MVLTYLDTGVARAAWNGKEPMRTLARDILFDENRIFVASRLLMLELVHKPTYMKFNDELAFYEALFEDVRWVDVNEDIFAQALAIGCAHGVNAIDALHVASAREIRAVEFATSEKPTKAMARVGPMATISIWVPKEQIVE